MNLRISYDVPMTNLRFARLFTTRNIVSESNTNTTFTIMEVFSYNCKDFTTLMLRTEAKCVLFPELISVTSHFSNLTVENVFNEF